MHWRTLLLNIMQLTYQSVWLTVGFLLLADNCMEAKPYTEKNNQRVALHVTTHQTLSTNKPMNAIEVTQTDKPLVILQKRKIFGGSGDQTALSKPDRPRRKKERKLKRRQKQKDKISKISKISKFNMKGYDRKDSLYKIMEAVKTEEEDLKTYKPELNKLKADMDQLKSISVGENDVLNYGKMDKFNPASLNLYSKMLELESKLLNEIIRNRDAHNTLTNHSSKLENLTSTVVENQQNFAKLKSQVDIIQKLLESEDEYHHSIEHKLSGVMLDIAEVNNLLSTADKRSSTKLDDKTIPVETSSKNHCQNTPNATKYRDCEEVYHHGHTSSGVYYITPLYSSCPIPVYCDMDTPPGGWLVIQRRQDGTTNFNQNWDTYRQGFGDVTKEFWLGNDNLFLLTNQRHYQLRVDLWDFYGSRVYADYLHFKVDGERDRYQLHVSNHSGTAADSLQYHNGVYFSTPDRDNDQYPGYHCADQWAAGWWFSNCWFAILNGEYHNTTDVEHRGISWNDWKAEQLPKVEMKMRPSGY